jgi:hypothetical protein
MEYKCIKVENQEKRNESCRPTGMILEEKRQLKKKLGIVVVKTCTRELCR